MFQTRSLVFRVVSSTAIAAALALSAYAQTSVRMTTPVNIANSANRTFNGPGDAIPISGGLATLDCGTGGPTSVTLSGSADSDTNVFSDNFFALTVNGTRYPNVCTGGAIDTVGNTQSPDCFNTAWYTDAFLESNQGQNPDTSIVNTNGVPFLNLTPYFNGVTGAIQVKVEAMDWGGKQGTSSTFLRVAGCTPITIKGTPIDPAAPDSLKQTFVFNNAPGKQVEFDADWTTKPNGGTVTIVPGTIPSVTDKGINPADWPNYVTNTSFANTQCVPHAGEVDASNNPLCKLYTLTCTNSLSPTPEGDNCPQSTARDLLFTDKFDADPVGIALITALKNKPNKGIGFLMGSDYWAPGSCNLIGPELNFLCPQNTLTSFHDLASGGTTRTTNSSFIVVTDVPLPQTTVTPVSPTLSGSWFNGTAWAAGASHDVTLNFDSAPGSLSAGDTDTNHFSPAGISSLTAGISAANQVPDTQFPVPGDIVNVNESSPCPPGNPAPAATFNSTATFTGLADGQYAVHYFATDCAATEELLFDVNDLSRQTNWVSFKTYPINIDTVAPSATITTPSNGATYTVGQNVLANYSCSDPAPGSGVPAANCVGTKAIGAAIDTSTVGPKTFTVTPTDLAGNVGPTATVSYNVVLGPSADLALRKYGPSSVSKGSNATYAIALINKGANTANSIVVTDPLPANTTFVSAVWKQGSCSLSGTDITCGVSTGTACSLNQANAIVCNIPSLAKFTLSNPVGIGIKVVLKVGVAVGGTVTNTATVTAGNVDPVLTNNTSSVVTKVTK